MNGDAILNILLSMGIPGLITASVIYLANKFVPVFIKVYKDSKESEQTQTKQIIEVATKASISNERVSIAIEQNTKALEQNNTVNREVVSNLQALNESFKIHDKRSEDINVDVKKILENVRKSGAGKV